VNDQFHDVYEIKFLMDWKVSLKIHYFRSEKDGKIHGAEQKTGSMKGRCKTAQKSNMMGYQMKKIRGASDPTIRFNNKTMIYCSDRFLIFSAPSENHSLQCTHHSWDFPKEDNPSNKNTDVFLLLFHSPLSLFFSVIF
jgi:hypothetical protein